MVIFSFLAAVIPAIALLIYYYRLDKAKPEPKGLVIKIFFLGILSIVPAIIIELLVSAMGSSLDSIPFLSSFFRAFIVAALIEELIKFMIVKKFAFNKTAFDEEMDGIVYIIAASMGFACFENVLYVMGTNMFTAILRAFTAIPMHAFASGIMGFYIGKAKFAVSEIDANAFFKKGLMYAILIHGFYDFFIMAIPDMTAVAGDYAGFTALMIFPILIFSFIKLKKLIRTAISDDKKEGRV